MSDADLFRNWQKRSSQEALVELLQTLQSSIYPLCAHILGHHQDAEDATQRVLLELLGVIRTLPSIDRIRGWIYRASILTALSLKRSQRRRMHHERAERAALPRSLTDEERDALHQHIAELDEDLRRLVVEYHFERKTLGDLAREAGCSTGAVWKRLQKGHDALRRSLVRAGIAGAALAILPFLESREAIASPKTPLSNEVIARAGEVSRAGASAGTASGFAVRNSLATLSAGIALAGAIVLGLGIYHRAHVSRRESIDLPLAARPSDARTAKAPGTPRPTISPSDEDAVLTFRTGRAFFRAFRQAIAVRDAAARDNALRRLGLAR